MLFAPPPPVEPPRAGAIALNFDSSVLGVAERPDGTVTVATTEGPGGEFGGGGYGRGSVLRLRQLGEAGAIGGPVAVPAQRPFERLTLLPSGTMLRYAAGTLRKTRTAKVRMREAGIDGRVIASSDIQAHTNAVLVDSITPGPEGALAVVVDASTDHRRSLSIATRAPGGAGFRSPVKLTTNDRRLTADEDPDMDSSDVDVVVAFAPGGGGAVVSAPESRHARGTTLRWISSDGTIGRRIDLGLKSRGQVTTQLAFTAAGKLTILASVLNSRSIPANRTGRVVAATIPFGSTTNASWQTLGRATYATTGDRLVTLAGGPGDHVTALTSTGDDIAIFEGDNGAPLRQTGTLAAHYPENLRLFAQPDGALSAIWQDNAETPFEDEGAYVAFRGAGLGAFSSPRRATPKGQSFSPGMREPVLEDAYSLSGGRIAMVYREYEGNSGPLFVSIVRP